MIAYRAMLDVPRELVDYVSRLLAAERHARGTPNRTRALTCWRQALFVLVWFRTWEDLTVLAAGLGISRATACRDRDEAVTVIAAQAPEWTGALHQVPDEGWAYVILDGKIAGTGRLRVKTISRNGETTGLWYSGKRRDFGGNIQAVMRPGGLPVWVFAGEPGSMHDLTCARGHALGARYAAAAAGRPALADPGCNGAGIGVHVRFRQPAGGRRPGSGNRTCTKVPRAMRALGARGFALLAGRWRVLRHITVSPSRIGDIAKAALVLTHVEHGDLPRSDHLVTATASTSTSWPL